MGKITDIVEKNEDTSLDSDSELAAIKLETQKLELEAKKLEVLEKQANLQDLQERLAERELRRETKRQRSVTNGATLKALAEADIASQKRCTHRKGGDGANAVIGGQGQDQQYAVLKHIFANGDMWVRCLRCGKTWKPPLRMQYNSDADYDTAVREYGEAIHFHTRNVTSKSVIFGFSDNGAHYRLVTANSNLR